MNDQYHLSRDILADLVGQSDQHEGCAWPDVQVILVDSEASCSAWITGHVKLDVRVCNERLREIHPIKISAGVTAGSEDLPLDTHHFCANFAPTSIAAHNQVEQCRLFILHGIAAPFVLVPNFRILFFLPRYRCMAFCAYTVCPLAFQVYP